MPTSHVPPDPETIRRTTAEILQGSDFQINQDTRAGETFADFMQLLFEWVISPFVWIFQRMAGLPDAVRWLVVIVLAIVLVLLLAHLTYTIVSVFRPNQRKGKFTAALSAGRRMSPEEFEKLAQEALTQQDYIAAVRFLFRASLAHLQSLEGRFFSPGLTNRQFLRRYQKSPVIGALQSFVEIIDTGWYGNGICREKEYLKCREAYAEIRRQGKEASHADRA